MCGKSYIIQVLLACSFLAESAASSMHDSLLVMFWNLENFFDYRNDGLNDSDKEFSSTGQRRWTAGRFYKKCDDVAKAILWMESRYGRPPDIIGFAEVENAFVLRSLLFATSLKKYDYSIVHFDSHDKRGIDVALLYRRSVFEKVSARAHRPRGPDSLLMTTRDILYAEMDKKGDGNRFHFLVNHLPSKYGGAKASIEKRKCAVSLLRKLCDSIVSCEGENIVAMGDFNETSRSDVMCLMGKNMNDMSWRLCAEGLGTIRFRGKWELIDMFWVSGDVVRRSRMEIVSVPFLTVWDNAYPGYKPLRTYSGPRYLGGVSDHCPVILLINCDD